MRYEQFTLNGNDVLSLLSNLVWDQPLRCHRDTDGVMFHSASMILNI